LTDGSGLPSDPSTGDYYLYIDGEYMYLDDRTGDDVTVTRGVLGTSADDHSSGSVVYAGQIEDGTDERSLRKLDEITDPNIKEVGDLEQTLEYKKAEFRISNTSVTINGLPKDRLRDAGSIYRPWVFEILDGSNVIFSGMVDGSSVSYSAETRNTSFDVLSWLEILDRAGSVPARDVFEVEVFGTRRPGDGYVESNQEDIQIKLNNEAVLADVAAQVGDVAVIETENSEVRKQIVGRDKDDNDRVIIFINAQEQGDDGVVRRLPGGGNYSDKLDPRLVGRTNIDYNAKIDFTINDNAVVRELVEAVNGDLSKLVQGEGHTYNLPDDYTVEIDVNYTVEAYDAQLGFLQASEDRTRTFNLSDLQVAATSDGYRLRTRDIQFENSIEDGGVNRTVDKVKDGEFRIRVKRDSTNRLADDLSSEDTVRILGQEIYGYNGLVSNDQVTYYEAKNVIGGLFQVKASDTTGRPQLGVLPYVFTPSQFDTANDFAREAPLDPRIELPDDPLKALRQIQQRRQFLLQERFVDRTNAQGDPIPGYFPKMVFRDSFFDTATQVSDRRVKTWEEDVSENEVRAVVIRPNESYLKGRAGPDVDERIGFYFDGIERYETAAAEQIRDRMGPPDGRNVIEIEMPIIPSDETGFKYSGEDTVENNPKIKRLAKFYYEHFSMAGREVSLTFGDDAPDWIGGYWYFQNQGAVVDDYVFVTQETKSIDNQSIDAQLTGRIGQEAATIEDAAPNAVIGGPKEVSRADSNGDVRVVLSGENSFSLSSNALAYTWERKPLSGSYTTVQSSGSILKDDVANVTSQETYVYRLTVTDKQTGTTDSTTHQVTVAPSRNSESELIQNQSFNVKTWQQEGEGVLEIMPDRYEGVASVEERSAVGGNIDKGQAFSNVARLSIDVDSVDTSANEVLLTGDYEEHFDKPFLYLFTDDERVEFDVSSTSYDSGSNQTTISLAESISSTNYVLAETGAFVTRVTLSTKHTSAIEVRVTGGVDGTIQTETHTYDFDNLAEVDVSVYNDESGAVYADILPDEDTAYYDVEYRKNGGNWNLVLNDATGSRVGDEIVPGTNVDDGDNIEVRVTPFNADDTQGRQVVRATFYNRSSGGGAQFDSITINGAGDITSGATDEFVLEDTGGGNQATLDVYNVQISQINSVPVGNFAQMQTPINDDALAFWDDGNGNLETSSNLAYTDTTPDGQFAGAVQPVLLSRHPMQVWPDSATSSPDIHIGSLEGMPKKDGDGNVPDPNNTYGANIYGIWLRPGDEAVVEGNVDYEGGSWFVGQDASFLIRDGATSNPLLRMGSETVGDSTQRGFYAYDGNDNVQAYFTRNGFDFADGSLSGDATSLAINVSDFTLNADGMLIDSDGGTDNTAIMTMQNTTKSGNPTSVRIGDRAGVPQAVDQVGPDWDFGQVLATVNDGQDFANAQKTVTGVVNYKPFEIDGQVRVSQTDCETSIGFDVRVIVYSQSTNEVLAEKTLIASGFIPFNAPNEETRDFNVVFNTRDFSDFLLVMEVSTSRQIDTATDDTPLDAELQTDFSNSNDRLLGKTYDPETTINSDGVFIRVSPNRISTIGETGTGAVASDGVTSVFGRTGQVEAESGDYTASQIDNFDQAAVDAVGASTPFANADLQNSTVTVAGNSVALGGSTGVSHSDLDGIGPSDHHEVFEPSDYNPEADTHDKTTSVSELTDFVSGVNQTVASTNYQSLTSDAISTSGGNNYYHEGNFSANHNDLNNIGPSDHHTRPSAGSGLSESSNTFSVNEGQINHDNLSGGTTSDAHHTKTTQAQEITNFTSSVKNIILTQTHDNGLTFRPSNSGGTIAIRFESNVNPGSDFGLLKWYDNNSTYQTGSDDETGVLALEAENDAAGGGIGDHTALIPTGHVYLNPGGEVRVGDASNYSEVLTRDNISKSDVGLSNVPNTDIAYSSTIAADDFTSSEVNSLRQNKLADASEPWNNNNYFDAQDARNALQAGTQYIHLDNTEMDDPYVGGQAGGVLGYDASVGLFLDYGSSGSGITKDVYPVLDVGNTITDANISLTYSGIDSQPSLGLSNSISVNAVTAQDTLRIPVK
jgi:hypothetical protein